MRTKRYLLSFLFATLFLHIGTAYSQIRYHNIRFKHLGLEDGLPHNGINAITQDSQGFMWFGTRNGLCRYDGYDMTCFNHEENDSTSLVHNIVTRLYNDSIHNMLWVSTDDGICSYNYLNERFTRYSLPQNIQADVSFTNISNGTLLATSSNGIFKYNPQADSFSPYLLTDSTNNWVRNVAEDSEHMLWIACRNGLKRFHLQKEYFVPLPQLLQPFAETCTYAVLIDKCQLVFSTATDVYIYHIQSNTLQCISQSIGGHIFYCATTDHTGNIWIGTEDGIFVFNNLYQPIAHFAQVEGDLSKLNDSPIYSLYCDKGHNMWVGTYFGGINYYTHGSDQFQIYPYGYSKNHLSGKAVRQIINVPHESILLCTEDGGLNYLNNRKEIVRSEELQKVFHVPGRNIHALYTDEDKSLWIGMFFKGILRYSPRTKQMTEFQKQTPEISSGYCIQQDKDKHIWYGGPQGLFVIDTNESNPIPRKICSTHIYTLICLNDSILWGGTRRKSLMQINTRTRQLTQLDILPKPDCFITNTYRDSDKKIWIGTEHNGLFVVNEKGEVIDSYNSTKLYSNSIRGIIEDDQKRMWIGTGNGLCCINPKNRQVEHYTTLDGLPINHFNYVSACKKPDGELYFGTTNGMISFYPQQVNRIKPKFKVVLTGIWSNGKLISPNEEDAPLSTSAVAARQITLSHNQAKSLRIDYSGLNFLYGKHTRYAMKLEGIDKNWQSVESQHQVRFSNLPTGHYVLKIKAGTDGENWDEQGQLNFKIRVLPPIWLSSWAFIIYCIIALCLIGLTYRYTKARLILKMKLKNEHEKRVNIEKMNQQKTNFFTYISHDLKTPLTLILSPLQRIIEQAQISNADKPKLQVIYRNANRMNYLIEELLSFSKIEMKQSHIRVRQGNIMRFINEASHIFNIVAQERELDFIVNLEETDALVWFSPSKLERILYNLLSNAFKYTSAGGCVTLSAKLIHPTPDECMAQISVKDTGRGIPAELQRRIFDSYYQVEQRDNRGGFGIGLALTRSLIHLHKGHIEVESQPGKGSNFIVTLNVCRQAFTAEERSTEEISTDDIRKYNQRLKDTIELIPERLFEKNNAKSRDIVLVVEDNKEMNEYIADILGQQYEVMCAQNGEEAC